MDHAPSASLGDTPFATPALSSPARVEANRANAALSTGPKTTDGLARSSGNALSHGLTARSVVVRGESAEAWQAFRDATLADLDARGPVETALATRVAELLWRLSRASAAEAAVADFALARAEQASIMAALDACDGPGDGSPFCFRSADTLADLRARALRARAAGEVAQAAIVAADDARLDPAAVGDVVRLVALAAGIGDPELVHGVAADEQARRIARGQKALSLPAWTAGGLRMVAAAMAASTGAHNFVDDDEESDDEEGDDEDEAASERARTPSTEGAALLSRARRVCLEATLRGLTAERDARQRLALAQGLAAVSEEAAPVRRHEAHLQRQLAGALAMLDGARGRRLPPAERTAETRDHRTGVRVVTHESPTPVQGNRPEVAVC
jgi:hypothetical protein